MNPSSRAASQADTHAASHDTSQRQDRAGAGGNHRRHRSAQGADHGGPRNRHPLRALRGHDVRCAEADQEIRELLRRY